jgi:hypothetical protein
MCLMKIPNHSFCKCAYRLYNHVLYNDNLANGRPQIYDGGPKHYKEAEKVLLLSEVIAV